MIPYTLTVTSHPIITLGFALSLFIGITLIGLIKHGFHFFHLFVPNGIPVVILPIIVLLEVLGYLTRPISLGVRLFANMFAGHTLLNIIAFFTWNIMIYGGVFAIFSILPIFLILALVSLEFVICALQAYVFYCFNRFLFKRRSSPSLISFFLLLIPLIKPTSYSYSYSS